MGQIPHNILINLASSTPGPSKTVPPYTTQYVFTSDPPVNTFTVPKGSVILDVTERPSAMAVNGDTLWTGCDVLEGGEVWVLQGVKNVKAQIDDKPTLTSLVDTFAHTQTYLRNIIDSRTP